MLAKCYVTGIPVLHTKNLQEIVLLSAVVFVALLHVRHEWRWSEVHLIIHSFADAGCSWCIAANAFQQSAHTADDEVVGRALQGLQLGVVVHVASHFV